MTSAPRSPYAGYRFPAEIISHVKSPGQAQRFLSAHDQIANLFHLRRDAITAIEYRAARTRALSIWAEVSGAVAEA